MSSEPNKGTIKVYNLSPQTRNSLAEGKRVIIEAGYQSGYYGLIYNGEIVSVSHSGLNTKDKQTEIAAQDGDAFLNGFVNVSYKKGQQSIDYFKQVVSAAGVEIDYTTDDAKKSILPRGKAMFGNTVDYMRQFAKNEDALFFVDDGKVCLVKAADPPRGEIVSLTPTSGLIGIPELTEDGVKGKCLLMPNFTLDGLVHVQSNEAGSGIFKIIEFTHSGDNRGNDWCTTFTGIAQPGLIPVTGNSLNK